jgi:hypothetical protein
LDDIQRNPTFGLAVNFKLEVVFSGPLKMKSEMLPDMNVRLRLVTRNLNLKILAYRRENRPHVWIAKVHFEEMTSFLADIKSQLTDNGAQWMITWERLSPNRVE